MPSDPRKRQKKLEKRAAKRKEKRHEVVRSQSTGLPGQLRAASAFPVLNCWITEAQGMGTVHISRQLPDGQVAFASFLVDRYCLGVKDVFFKVLHRLDYETKIVQRRDPEPRRQVSPADARKLIEGAVQYAGGLGLPPHADYQTAMLLFGDIDAAASTAQFEFGKDGKPFFIAGPHDTPERCKQIMAILMKSCGGPDGFHYLMPISGDELVQPLPPGARLISSDDSEDQR